MPCSSKRHVSVTSSAPFTPSYTTMTRLPSTRGSEGLPALQMRRSGSSATDTVTVGCMRPPTTSRPLESRSRKVSISREYSHVYFASVIRTVPDCFEIEGVGERPKSESDAAPRAAPDEYCTKVRRLSLTMMPLGFARNCGRQVQLRVRALERLNGYYIMTSS